jgi:hypothetical protein
MFVGRHDSDEDSSISSKSGLDNSSDESIDDLEVGRSVKVLLLYCTLLVIMCPLVV